MVIVLVTSFSVPYEYVAIQASQALTVSYHSPMPMASFSYSQSSGLLTLSAGVGAVPDLQGQTTVCGLKRILSFRVGKRIHHGVAIPKANKAQQCHACDRPDLPAVLVASPSQYT